MSSLKQVLTPPTRVEITRVANGFELTAPNYPKDGMMRSLDETFVFNDLDELVAHLKIINFELTDE